MAEQKIAEGMVETGLSFATNNGNRWMKHSVGLDVDYVRGHISEEAGERFDSLPLMQKLLVVRAVTELSVCRFRQTRHDPDYTPNEYEAWVKVINELIGYEGLDRLGI